MAKRRPPRLPVERAALVFGLLGEPSRLRILLHLLDKQEASVGALRAATGQSRAATSHHLMLLRTGHLAGCRRDGRRVLYRVSSDLVSDLLRRVGGEEGPGP
jgi:DNA-binding transcriptional ArsR family regulator